MKKDFKFLKWNGKQAVALLSLTVVLSLLLVGGSLAYIFTQTDFIQNIFQLATVEVTVNGNVIKNDSDIPVYVRAAVVVTWVKDGVTLSDDTQYTMTVKNQAENGKPGWAQASDGYWYYTHKIEPGASLELIDTISATVDAPEGASLQVEILSSVIQANPTSAIENSWGIVPNGDGTLTIN